MPCKFTRAYWINRQIMNRLSIFLQWNRYMYSNVNCEFLQGHAHAYKRECFLFRVKFILPCHLKIYNRLKNNMLFVEASIQQERSIRYVYYMAGNSINVADQFMPLSFIWSWKICCTSDYQGCLVGQALKSEAEIFSVGVYTCWQ